MSLNRVVPPTRRSGVCAVVMLTVCLLWPASVHADEHELGNTLGMTLRLLPAGRFEQGESDTALGFSKDHTDFNTADDDRPVHPVVLTRPFYLATTEVTVGQFRKFVEASGYKTTAEQSKLSAIGWDPVPPPGQPRHIGTFRDGGGFHWRNPGFSQAEDHPVVCVSFADAQAFCAWLSQQEKATYRLPTEAEWEYAARAGTTTYFSFGDAYRGQIHLFANIGNVELEKAFPDRVRRQWLVDVSRDPADPHVFTAPVGSYRANPWGLHDLYGNVWEWCEDRYLDTAYTPYVRMGFQEVRPRAVDPRNLEKASDDGDWRVIRGGSWFNSPVQCRSSVRGYYEANDAASYLGFRVVREGPVEAVAAARSRFQRSEAARTTLNRLIGGLRERRDGRLSLQLRPEHLTDELFSALADLDDPVDLFLDAQGRLKGADIARLAKAKRLTGLILSGTGPALTDDDLAPLADHPDLEQLQITGTPKLSDKLLLHLRNGSRLESLQLDGEGITDSGLQILPRQPRLKTLLLTGTGVQGVGLDHFEDSPLERFSCNHLTDAGARELSRFTRLRELGLSRSSLTGEACASISRLHLLNRLDLSGCRQIPDEAFAELGNLVSLRSLSLTETAAGDRAVAGLMRLNDLREIRFGSDQLSDAGVRQLCGLVSIETLGIHEQATALTDSALSDLWRLVNLHSLELAAPGITGSGLAPLGELPRLEWLSLSGPHTTDAALKHAAQSASLRRLQVGNSRTGGPAGVTDAGVLALAAAKNLKQLDLTRRTKQITDTALKELRAQRPDLTIDGQ
jgi:sulfatase modifying factor 1